MSKAQFNSIIANYLQCGELPKKIFTTLRCFATGHLLFVVQVEKTSFHWISLGGMREIWEHNGQMNFQLIHNTKKLWFKIHQNETFSSNFQFHLSNIRRLLALLPRSLPEFGGVAPISFRSKKLDFLSLTFCWWSCNLYLMYSTIVVITHQLAMTIC